MTRIEGKCHCGNIAFRLEWPGEATGIVARSCGCEFCTQHGASWTSHRDARLSAAIRDAALLSRYRFATATADFYACARCGAVPLAASEIEGRLYAVVNINTLQGIDRNALACARIHFDDEARGERLDRRKRNWIPNVTIGGG